ncbi:hypothetical protein MCOR27_000843 [Pyricularia oryzae]|nr:hypothetical protein MCOR27_000843 [Pyricularia oryzae]KAI6395092.1 hypothetical protein MCOR24_009404 [Pyricularia oryzae]KAI6543988.1 hypothetical protein MCOR05_002761 [Pyricularia oryzae]KAI6594551.1 hypothetical protein MCOR06_003280 [Pyricularia oryzae]KAI6597951.1 hypothetical protein MCOR12_005543 [Pyricularia oryzae]
MKCLGCLLCVPLDEKEEDERTAERYAKNRYLANHPGDYCWPEYGVCIHPRPPNRVGRSRGGLVTSLAYQKNASRAFLKTIVAYACAFV